MNHDNDPFGRSSIPASCSTREDRVRWFVKSAHTLIASGDPACVSTGSSMLAWIEEGGGIGALERDFLRITPERGSKLTPAAVWHKLQCNEGGLDGETPESSNDECDTKGTSNDDEHDDYQA